MRPRCVSVRWVCLQEGEEEEEDDLVGPLKIKEAGRRHERILAGIDAAGDGDSTRTGGSSRSMRTSRTSASKRSTKSGTVKAEDWTCPQ